MNLRPVEYESNTLPLEHCNPLLCYAPMAMHALLVYNLFGLLLGTNGVLVLVYRILVWGRATLSIDGQIRFGKAPKSLARFENLVVIKLVAMVTSSLWYSC